MKYIVSTTTHTINGSQIDAWEGDEIEAETMDQAIKDGTEWEAKLLTDNGATDIQIEENKVYYTAEDGEGLYKEIHADMAIDFEAAVEYMDDEIREKLHAEMCPCTDDEFFRAYAKRHLEKFGEEFELAKDNPTW